jgi:MFS family permease
MAFSPNSSVAIALWICRTFVMNSSWPVQQAYIIGVVAPAERATASSLTYAAWSIAGALTPPIGGALLGAHRYALPFLLGAVCYVAGLGAFYAFFRNIRTDATPRSLVAYERVAVGD